MKTLIVFKSKSGTTEQYARWLTDEISNSDMIHIDNFQTSIVNEYDRIVFALPTYGGIIDGKDILERYWQEIEHKSIYLVIVGVVPQSEAWSLKAYNHLSEDVRRSIKGYVKLAGVTPGGNSNKVSWFERLMVKLFMKTDVDVIKKQNEVSRIDLKPAIEMLKK